MSLGLNHVISFRLTEVGKLETPKLQGKYETGQLILHRVFGYRGVILFPWLARVYDRDIPSRKEGWVYKKVKSKYIREGCRVRAQTRK